MLKLFVIGHLGRDAEVKDIGGNKVIDFSIAHTEKFTSQGVQKEKTTWINCSYWIDKTAVAQYLKKGTQVFLEGTPEAYAYTNKENQNVASLRLRISNLRLLGSSNKNDSSSTDETSSSAPNSSSNASDDDLPF